MSHHGKHKRRIKRKTLRIFCVIFVPILIFFGIGEFFQGSAVSGIAMMVLAAILILWTLSMKIYRQHR
ncbi:MAG: hypothetical protein J7L86_08505 [Candidatus Marinimicrobia bacterium]|nr:hypothetical protein [Candidatus Neomarinimicrobiota bacterium]